MAKQDSQKKYTQPELREKIKRALMESDKGGNPGQWSARKSQLLVHEYERQGGGYEGQKDKAAHSLEDWSRQEWQTQDGEVRARDGRETGRYLPKEAWSLLSEEEKGEAEQHKREGSRKGKPSVAYTPAVKRALRQVTEQTGPEPSR